MVKLGDRVKDSITGLEGTVTGRCAYLNGCVSLEIQPYKLHDGRPIKTVWLDEQRVDQVSAATAGGPHDHTPPSPSTP